MAASNSQIYYFCSMNLTAIIIKGDGYFIEQIKEFGGVLTQGTTIEKTKSNLIDVLALWSEDTK